MEKVLVEGLRFDLLVELPYFHLLKFIRLLEGFVLYTVSAVGMHWRAFFCIWPEPGSAI